MKVFLRKRLDGSLVPACDVSSHLARRIAPETLVQVDWKTRNTRSVQWHRRYWALCTMIYANVEGIDLHGQRIDFTSPDVVHMTLKGLAGLYDACIVLPDGTRAFLIRSIAFDQMTADEWAQVWPRLLDVVHADVLPAVSRSDIEAEIGRLAS